MIRIPSPNPDRSLLTLAEVKAAVGVTDGSQDVSLTEYLNEISALITAACKLSVDEYIPPNLRLEDIVETVRPRHGWQSFSLSRGPVVSITSIVENGTSLATDQYEISGRTLFRLVGHQRHFWPFWPHNDQAAIVVTYSAGWAIVPDDLKYAAKLMIRAQRIADSRVDPALKMRRIEGVSEHQWWIDPKADTIIPANVMDILIRGNYINLVGWMR